MFKHQLLAVTLLVSANFSAQASTYYVAGNASAANTGCTAAAPCTKISAALDKAKSGDSIICLAPPERSAIYINKSIVIDCSQQGAQVGDTGYASNGFSGVVINVADDSPTERNRTVRLKGLTIDGATNVFTNYPSGLFYDNGIDIVSAGTVYIEDCIISNTYKAIYDHRTTGQSRLNVTNTSISGSPLGIVAASRGPAATILDNTRLMNNGYGLAAATGNNVVINRSIISGSGTAGVSADAGSQINIVSSSLSHNNWHVNNYGVTRLQENAVQFGNLVVQGNAPVSLGGNRFSGNGPVGAVPNVANGAPADVYN